MIWTAGPPEGRASQEPPRPNILWLTSEDNGPHLGAYGDALAKTPNLDRLAARGVVYKHVWSNAPVCAPARTAIISGLYPTATGSQHMRSRSRLPSTFRMFPQYLRQAGYYVTNNSKEDYNLEKPGQVWDDSSTTAHWRNRPRDAPFFAVFNTTVTHESQIRRRPHQPQHDPALVRVPAYHPDTPEVRRDWAQYYDKLTEMDLRLGERLRELEAAGLAQDTIVFYFGDHGPGLPRSKRTALDSGLRVPLIVSLPPRFQHLAPPDLRPGTTSEELVAFVDLAPTVLSLAGIRPPDYFQGRAFLGVHRAPPSEYLYGFRDRMDERYDLVRAVRNRRYVYVRNYLPHRIPGQFVSYMFQTPTTQVWKRLYEQGRLAPEQASFWREKPTEELYDLLNDADEVRNLAASPAHGEVLERLRAELRRHLLATRDLGFLPEAEIHSRCRPRERQPGITPWEYGRDEKRYPLREILTTAELASDRARFQPQATAALRGSLRHRDSAVRYWGAVGLTVRGEAAVEAARPELRRALRDPAVSVRIAAAEALGRYGSDDDAVQAVETLLQTAWLGRHSIYDVVLALNALDYVDERARGARRRIEALPTTHPSVFPAMSTYVPRLVNKILADFEDPTGS